MSKKIQSYVSKETYENLEADATHAHRSVSQQVAYLLDLHYKPKEGVGPQ